MCTGYKCEITLTPAPYDFPIQGTVSAGGKNTIQPYVQNPVMPLEKLLPIFIKKLANIGKAEEFQKAWNRATDMNAKTGILMSAVSYWYPGSQMNKYGDGLMLTVQDMKHVNDLMNVLNEAAYITEMNVARTVITGDGHIPLKIVPRIPTGVWKFNLVCMR